ncbi:MAG: hypothetical protein ACI96W_003905, partial [Paraglaciecola sp.]
AAGGYEVMTYTATARVMRMLSIIATVAFSLSVAFSWGSSL